jgi:cellulose synthase/poly-beta-1,6-N-acetylglucosamine synthase-like glycosyltransferase
MLAKHPVILTTDGDCSVSTHWLQSFQEAFSNENVQLISGPVAFKNKSSIFSKLQSLEFAGLIGMGAASINLGFPHMCNGADSGCRRKAYH